MSYYKRFNQWVYFHLRRKKGCLAGWIIDTSLCMIWLFGSAVFLIIGSYYAVFWLIRKLVWLIFGIKPKPKKYREYVVIEEISARESGYAYETRVAKALRKQGYRDVYVTSKSGDYGADVIATDRCGNKVCIQCKHYTSPVGVKAIQEVVAAKGHYGCSKSAVYTNSSFTQQAKNLAFENEVELYEFFDAIMD